MLVMSRAKSERGREAVHIRCGARGVLHQFFFFSSRRRHTRFDCDWSSDVCSSDLMQPPRKARIGSRSSQSRSKVRAKKRKAESDGANKKMGQEIWHRKGLEMVGEDRKSVV